MTISRERADFLTKLATHRGFLRYTCRDLSDEQARLRTTTSALCLGGLIKHVAGVEQAWMAFAQGGAEAMDSAISGSATTWEDDFRLLEGETLAGVLQHYEEVAKATTEIVETRITDFDQEFALPERPWFEKGAKWSVRTVLLHIMAETAQHAGHADIIRETLDGQKTMG